MRREDVLGRGLVHRAPSSEIPTRGARAAGPPNHTQATPSEAAQQPALSATHTRCQPFLTWQGEPPEEPRERPLCPWPTGSARGQAPPDACANISVPGPHVVPSRPEKPCHLPLDKAAIFTAKAKLGSVVWQLRHS